MRRRDRSEGGNRGMGRGKRPLAEPRGETVRTSLPLALLEGEAALRDLSARVGITETVTLEGLVASDSEKQIAEADAWYVFGVRSVLNHVLVEPTMPAAD
jgi:osmotically-inducible protein OsmY